MTLMTLLRIIDATRARGGDNPITRHIRHGAGRRPLLSPFKSRRIWRHPAPSAALGGDINRRALR
jgi:hypothetical protein